MAVIGKINMLRVVKQVDFGLYLDGGEHGEILLPKRYVPADCNPGDEVEVFVYLDSEDRIIATTETPLAIVGEFAALRVVSVSSVGAFLDIGLMKDILVPFREQRHDMQVGETHVVYVYLDDKTNRLVASAKLDRFLSNTPPTFREGEEVDILVCHPTDLGYKAIVNDSYFGVLYKSEVFQPLEIGEQTKAFINKVREDGKIDLILHKPGYEKTDDISKQILDKLKMGGGFIGVTDKTDPEIIYKMFGVSKKTFKKAIGALFRSRKIAIEKEGIRIIS